MDNDKKYIGIIAGVILIPLVVVTVALGGLGVVLFSSEEIAEQEEETPVVIDSPDVLAIEETNDENRFVSNSPKEPRGKELSRNDEYKIMEMYVYDRDWQSIRGITLEIPIEWEGPDESNQFWYEGEKGTFKIWLPGFSYGTEEDIKNDSISYRSIVDVEPIIYSNGDYDVFFYYDPLGITNDYETGNITIYYIYANEEYLIFTGYVFVDNKKEYEGIFKRIAESIEFFVY